MATKVYDCMVAVSKYKDQNGNDKTKWENVGAIWQDNDSNGNTYCYLMMKRIFNPAGITAREGSDAVKISLFKPQPKQQGQQGQQSGYNPQTSQSFNGGGYNQQQQQPSAFGEAISDIPF